MKSNTSDVNKNTEIKSTVQEAVIAKVSLKIPLFWKPDPRIWFLQLEAQFRNTNISVDQTKYDYVVSSIDADILSQVTDILVSPPTGNKYKSIKEKLISVFVESETQPSQLLCEMKNLVGDKVSDSFLKTLWLQRIPVNMISILSVSSDDLAKLVTTADKVWDLNPPSAAIAPIATEAISSSNITKLQHQISELLRLLIGVPNEDPRALITNDFSQNQETEVTVIQMGTLNLVSAIIADGSVRKQLDAPHPASFLQDLRSRKTKTQTL